MTWRSAAYLWLNGMRNSCRVLTTAVGEVISAILLLNFHFSGPNGLETPVDS